MTNEQYLQQQKMAKGLIFQIINSDEWYNSIYEVKTKVTAVKLKGGSQASALLLHNQNNRFFAHAAAHFITGPELKIMRQWYDTKLSTR